MLAKVSSCTLIGLNGYIVDVELDISNGIPAFDIVGLPDSAVKEAKERVRTAIKNSNIIFPTKRITVNLAPADIRKEGPSFDLPIALGILCCIGAVSESAIKNTLVLGELSLDGTIRPVNGVLPMVYSAFKNKFQKCIVPYENGEEAALVQNIEVYAVKNITELIEHLQKNTITPYTADLNFITKENEQTSLLDFKDVKGQQNVKRALEIAAAGSHNMIMIGPPGSGKTMMAKRLPSILPDLTFEESIEITKIYSVAGLLKNKNALIRTRPFRAPHHTISAPALAGGGRVPKPGEVSLAHNGVLFMDELPEFQRTTLEVMRQPLEDAQVVISRVNATLTYPSNFMLIAAMNPCPCGYLGDKSQQCRCMSNEIIKYTNKISGPLLDRIDIMAETVSVKYDELQDTKAPESSALIKERVLKAQKIQLERYKNESIYFNSQLSPAQIDAYLPLGKSESQLLKTAFKQLNLSARAYHKILKVARTVADLAGAEQIQFEHIAEVLQYRSLDRKYMF